MEILKKLKDRRIQIIIIFSMIFIIMVVRLAVLTITNGEYYREMSVNKRLKQNTSRCETRGKSLIETAFYWLEIFQVLLSMLVVAL